MFTHLEKCAGSSLSFAAGDLFGEHRVDLRDGQTDLNQLSKRQLSDIWFLSGHFHYGNLDKYFPKRKLYLATVRDPADRFASWINYVSLRPDHPDHAILKETNFFFNEAMHKLIEVSHFTMNNPMLTALKVPDNYCCLVPHEDVGKIIAELYAKFASAVDKSQSTPDYRRNVGKYDSDLGTLDKKLFYKHNQKDLDLYLATKDNVEVQMQKLRQSLNGQHLKPNL